MDPGRRRVVQEPGVVMSAPAHPIPQRERGHASQQERRGQQPSRSIRVGSHCAGFGGFTAGGEVVPPCFKCCLVARFCWRHSGRLFSSPALHACFVARDACRTSWRWSRRSIPCVWAETGTALSSIMPAANEATALPRESFMFVLLSTAASIAQGHSTRGSDSSETGRQRPGSAEAGAGPVRSDQFWNRGSSVHNFGAEQLNVRVEVNFDSHGHEAHQGSAGGVAAVAPNPAYWVDVPAAAMTVL